MGWIVRLTPAVAGAMALAAGSFLFAAQDPATPPAMPLGSGPGPEQFAGHWDYNADESINVATGRPEQSPAAARRVGAPTGGRTPVGPAGAGAPGLPNPGGIGPGAGAGSPGGFGGGNRQFESERMADQRYRAMMQLELRALTRDLMEVPETLTFRVAPPNVSITDDLERELVFDTSITRMEKYQLSAAQFEARAYWEGRVLHKRIEGPRGFRMSEMYFLSQDARRLFVVIRLGEPKPDVPPIGVNRVYDRVNEAARSGPRPGR
jgi:hypothetical protein